jgi:hypothetical protein
MFALIVILVVSLGFLLAKVGRKRHSTDPMREHEQAFATLRRIVESPRVQLNGFEERLLVASGHVRILSERPAGLPRSRRKRPAQRSRTAAQRRRRLTTAHPKIAHNPLSPSAASSQGTPKNSNSLGRNLEVLGPASNGSDRRRAAADDELEAATEETRSDNPAPMTLARDEANRRNSEIAKGSDLIAPMRAERGAGRSRLKRRAGGRQDALTAAIERAVSHINGATGDIPLTDEPIPALFGVPRQSA